MFRWYYCVAALGCVWSLLGFNVRGGCCHIIVELVLDKDLRRPIQGGSVTKLWVVLAFAACFLMVL